MGLNKEKMDWARVLLAIGAAVLSGGAALWGVYSKARQESRAETTVSYETLAPEINALKRSVEELKMENARLRQTAGVAEVQEARPRERVRPRKKPEAAPSPTAQGEEPPAPSAPAPPAPAPPAPPAPAPPVPPGGETPPPAEPEPTVKDIVVEKVEDRIPIDFEKAEEIFRDIQKRRGPTNKGP